MTNDKVYVLLKHQHLTEIMATISTIIITVASYRMWHCPWVHPQKWLELLNKGKCSTVAPFSLHYILTLKVQGQYLMSRSRTQRLQKCWYVFGCNSTRSKSDHLHQWPTKPCKFYGQVCLLCLALLIFLYSVWLSGKHERKKLSFKHSKLSMFDCNILC